MPMAGTAVHNLNDQDLLDGMLALKLACGKSHSSLTKRRRQWFCFLLQSLKVEADLRGLPTPSGPVHAGDLRRDPPPV